MKNGLDPLRRLEQPPLWFGPLPRLWHRQPLGFPLPRTIDRDHLRILRTAHAVASHDPGPAIADGDRTAGLRLRLRRNRGEKSQDQCEGDRQSLRRAQPRCGLRPPLSTSVSLLIDLSPSLGICAVGRVYALLSDVVRPSDESV